MASSFDRSAVAIFLHHYVHSNPIFNVDR